MAVPENGWATLSEAESYFAYERLETEHWDNLSSDDEKNKTLNMAYNRIYYDPNYSVPEAGSESADQKVYLIKAQSEMAYYIALHLSDEDRRKGIQIQGVISAGIVKENYDKNRIDTIPIPPFAKYLLKSFKTKATTAILDVDRDEDESVDSHVDDF